MHAKHSRILRCAALWLLSAGLGLAQAQTTTVAGGTPGQFSVSESGAATYRIPLPVPPGVAGMEPKLELNYNSQGGNGLLGMGWGLGGLSIIGRCPRIIANDGVRGSVSFDMNDRYCMDGQRLVLVSGTYGAAGSEYRTELDSFSKIVASGTAGNGVASFTVQTKAGLTMEYGNTADSRIEAQGKATARAWAVNKISDVKNNFMTFVYTEDDANGEVYLNTLHYGNQSLEMAYEAAPDPSVGYSAGSKLTRSKRLKTITAKSGANLVRQTILRYVQSGSTQRSVLGSVQTCNSLNQCFPSIEFEFGSEGSGFAGTQMSWPLPAASGAAGYMSKTDTTGRYMGLVDLNGDGLPDFYASGQSAVWLNTGSGFASTPTPWPLPAASGAVGYMSKTDTTGQYMGLVDINGDGLPDFYASGQSVVWLNTGSGFASTPTPWPLPVASGAAGYMSKTDATGQYMGLVDLNGDGLPDFYASGQSAVWLNTGSGFASTPTPWPLPAASGAAGYMSRTDTTGQYMALVDLNGDGLPDFYASGQSTVWLNTGSGFAGTPTPWPLPAASGAAGYMSKTDTTGQYMGLVDLNGDGLPDFYASGQSAAWLNTGSGFASTLTPRPLPASSGAAGYMSKTDTTGQYMGLVDINGDGLPDFYASGQSAVWSAGLDTSRRLVRVSSQNYVITISYEGSGVYTRYGDAVFPEVDTQTFNLVNSVSSSNGIGGMVTTQYSYGGLKAQLGTGRGMLGFRWMKSKNLANNIESYTEFNQGWPFTGSVLKSETRLAGSGNAGVLKRTTSSYAQGAGSATGSTFVYPGQSVEESWDLGGTPYPTVTNVYQYGQGPQYGDPTQISVSNSAGAGKTTVNEYWPANTGSGNWILGRLKKATVTSVTP
ncbi:FG-GAP repeat domain-containing protein [Polaromonas sp. LjRoot131]|uniref:FG-GAP repeat domain-containing protein n=1 Tax=Polaromonas sp. LjRoot131 TaxID=3342262 RepID=UPI003ED0CBFE